MGRARDEYFTSSRHSDFDAVGSYPLNSNYSMDLQIYVSDAGFDNDDNEYGKITLHNYVNM